MAGPKARRDAARGRQSDRAGQGCRREEPEEWFSAHGRKTTPGLQCSESDLARWLKATTVPAGERSQKQRSALFYIANRSAPRHLWPASRRCTLGRIESLQLLSKRASVIKVRGGSAPNRDRGTFTPSQSLISRVHKYCPVALKVSPQSCDECSGSRPLPTHVTLQWSDTHQDDQRERS